MLDNFKKVELKGFRYYQEEADNAIYKELLINNKCIVKMFCGTSVATESESESDEGGQPADKLKKLLEESGFQIDSKRSSVEKFSLFVCSKA